MDPDFGHSRDQSPISPLGSDKGDDEGSLGPDDDVGDGDAIAELGYGLEDNRPPRMVQQDEYEPPREMNDGWKQIIDSPDITVSQLREYLEKYDGLLQELYADMDTAKADLKAARQTHRGSIVSLHNKMFKKLLDAEESHESDLEEAQRKIVMLERQCRQYEQQLGGGQTSNIDEMLAREEKHQQRVQDLEKSNKELAEQLKIAQLKTETADRNRRESVASLHNRMFKKLLDAEEETATKTEQLQKRIAELEQQVRFANSENEAIESNRRQSISTLHNNMFQQLLDAEAEHEAQVAQYKEKIKNLEHQLKLSELEKTVLKDANEPVDAQALPDDIGLLKERCLRLMQECEAYKKQLSISEQKIAAKNDEVKALKREVQHTQVQAEQTQEVEELRQRVQQLSIELERSSEELNKQKEINAEVETTRRQSVSYLSNQMMNKLLEAEAQHEADMKGMKDQIHDLERKLKEQKILNDTLETTRRNSVTTISASMFQKLLAAEQDKQETIKQYENQLEELREELEDQKSKNEEAIVRRRGSISELHETMFKKLMEAENRHAEEKEQLERQKNGLEQRVKELTGQVEQTERLRASSIANYEKSMWNNLLEAEDDYKKLEKRLSDQIERLKQEIAGLRDANQHLANTKMALIEQCSQEINYLRSGIRVMNRIHG